MCWRVYTKALFKTTGADNNSSSVAFDTQVRQLGRAFETILSQGGGNLNNPVFKSSSAWGLPGWPGGC